MSKSRPSSYKRLINDILVSPTFQDLIDFTFLMSQKIWTKAHVTLQQGANCFVIAVVITLLQQINLVEHAFYCHSWLIANLTKARQPKFVIPRIFLLSDIPKKCKILSAVMSTKATTKRSKTSITWMSPHLSWWMRNDPESCPAK